MHFLGSIQNVSTIVSLFTITSFITQLWFSLFQEDVTPTSQIQVHRSEPASNRGLITVELLGRLGNNVPQIAFAKYLSEELNWPVVYRKGWSSEWLGGMQEKCFFNVTKRTPKPDTAEKMRFFRLNDVIWSDLNWRSDTPLTQQHSIYLNEWMQRNSEVIKKWTNQDVDRSLREGTLRENISNLKNGSVRILDLKGFFLHYKLYQGLPLSRWFMLDNHCCVTPAPSTSTVVIHIRDSEDERFNHNKGLGIYRDLLQHYGYASNPIWIVSQPTSLSSNIVLGLQREFPHAKIHTGTSGIDAFCILRNAHILIGATSSTFSQTAALLADEIQVYHMPIYKTKNPLVTLGNPAWTYDIFDEYSDKIVSYNHSFNQIVFRMD